MKVISAEEFLDRVMAGEDMQEYIVGPERKVLFGSTWISYEPPSEFMARRWLEEFHPTFSPYR